MCVCVWWWWWWEKRHGLEGDRGGKGGRGEGGRGRASNHAGRAAGAQRGTAVAAVAARGVWWTGTTIVLGRGEASGGHAAMRRPNAAALLMVTFAASVLALAVVAGPRLRVFAGVSGGRRARWTVRGEGASVQGGDSVSEAMASRLASALDSGARKATIGAADANDHHHHHHQQQQRTAAAERMPESVYDGKSAEDAFGEAVRRGSHGSRAVVLTFFDAKALPLGRTWLWHAEAAGVPHAVGALDEATLRALRARGVPAFPTPELTDSADLKGTGHSTGGWKQLGVIKFRYALLALQNGLVDVAVVSDADALWLRDPTPCLLRGEAAPDGAAVERLIDPTDAGSAAGSFAFDEGAACADIAAADVSVSSDNLSVLVEAAEGSFYSRHGQLNTGVVVWRNTPRALSLGERMLSAMRGDVEEVNGVRVKDLKTDQQVYNHLAARGALAAECYAESFGDAARARAAWRSGQSAPDLARAGAPSRLCALGERNSVGALDVDMGILPPPLVANGHAWAIKHSMQAVGRVPLAAHFTHVFGALGNTMAGKTHRMRHMGVWRGEEMEGGRLSVGTGVGRASGGDARTGNGRVLLLRSLPMPVDAGSEAELAKAGAREAWDAKFPGNFPEHLRRVTPAADARLKAHLRLVDEQRLGVLAGLAAAHSAGLGTLVLPRHFWCACDRSNAGHDNIFSTGCMVPGSEKDNFLPMSCPPDQLFNNVALIERAKTEFGIDIVYAPEVAEGVARESVDFFDAGCAEGGGGGGSCAAAASLSLRMEDAQRLLDALRGGRGVDSDGRDSQLPEAMCDGTFRPLEWRGWCSECHWEGNSGECASFVSEGTLSLARVRASRGGSTQIACFELPAPKCDGSRGAADAGDDDSTFQ